MKVTINQNLRKKIVFIFFFLICFLNLQSQPILNSYIDAGRSNISNGIYIKTSVIGSYRLGKYEATGGFQADLDYNHRSAFSGLTVKLSRDFMFWNKYINIEAFYLKTRASAITGETNWGFLLNTGRKHFKIELGTNFRTYSFSDYAVRKYKLDKGTTRCREVYNLMYSITYDLKTKDEPWNAGITITDADHFDINQENNIIFNLHGLYNLSPSVSLYSQIWYEAAGITNLHINYFGRYIRVGIVWKINQLPLFR